MVPCHFQPSNLRKHTGAYGLNSIGLKRSRLSRKLSKLESNGPCCHSLMAQKNLHTSCALPALVSTLYCGPPYPHLSLTSQCPRFGSRMELVRKWTHWHFLRLCRNLAQPARHVGPTSWVPLACQLYRTSQHELPGLPAFEISLAACSARYRPESKRHASTQRWGLTSCLWLCWMGLSKRQTLLCLLPLLPRHLHPEALMNFQHLTVASEMTPRKSKAHGVFWWLHHKFFAPDREACPPRETKRSRPAREQSSYPRWWIISVRWSWLSFKNGPKSSRTITLVLHSGQGLCEGDACMPESILLVFAITVQPRICCFCDGDHLVVQRKVEHVNQPGHWSINLVCGLGHCLAQSNQFVEFAVLVSQDFPPPFQLKRCHCRFKLWRRFCTRLPQHRVHC